jgi:hypothetical protein
VTVNKAYFLSAFSTFTFFRMDSGYLRLLCILFSFSSFFPLYMETDDIYDDNDGYDGQLGAG